MYGKPNVTQQVEVTTATPVTISTGTDSIPLVYPMVVTAVPGATGTLLVEFQVAVDGVWQEWPDGAVSTTTTFLLKGRPKPRLSQPWRRRRANNCPG